VVKAVHKALQYYATNRDTLFAQAGDHQSPEQEKKK